MSLNRSMSKTLVGSACSAGPLSTTSSAYCASITPLIVSRILVSYESLPGIVGLKGGNTPPLGTGVNALVAEVFSAADNARVPVNNSGGAAPGAYPPSGALAAGA